MREESAAGEIRLDSVASGEEMLAPRAIRLRKARKAQALPRSAMRARLPARRHRATTAQPRHGAQEIDEEARVARRAPRASGAAARVSGARKIRACAGSSAAGGSVMVAR